MVDKGVVIYRTTRNRLLSGKASKCQLCCMLIELIELGSWEDSDLEIDVDFQIDVDPDNPVDEPASTQYLLIHSRVVGQSASDRYLTFCMYTPSGTSG